MYFIARKGTETHTKLMDVERRARAAIVEANAFVKAEFNEDSHYGLHRSWGGVGGVVFKNGQVPEGWIRLKHTSDGWRPHASRKALADIRAKLKALPRVMYSEVGDAINLGGMKFIGGFMIEAPSSLVYNDEACLYKLNDVMVDTYVIPDGVEEITTTVFEKMKEELTADQKARDEKDETPA